MKNGDGNHLTILHLYTNYTITDKPMEDLTALQYASLLIITEEIMEFKQDNKPMVVI